MTNSTLFVQQRTRSKKLVYFLLITRAKNGSSYVVEQHVPRSKLAKNAKNAFFLITNYESFLSKDSQKYNNFFLISNSTFFVPLHDFFCWNFFDHFDFQFSGFVWSQIPQRQKTRFCMITCHLRFHMLIFNKGGETREIHNCKNF